MDQNLFGSRSGIGYIPGAIKEWAEVIEKKAERLEVNGMSIYKGLVIGRLKKFEKRDGATTTLIMSCVYDEFSTVQFESTNTVRQTILNSLEEGMTYSVAFSTYKNFDKSIILKVADIQPILEKDFSLTKELFATEIHFSRAFHN
uniref:Phage portal protein n=1 Tax=Parastrongyloides trichosuri TaxID=131310 RepID=A0A0N4ZZI6_PARTI